MGTYFIVSHHAGIELSCLYYGNRKERAVRNIEKTKQGDILEIMDEGRFLVGGGWYILVNINNQYGVFASIKELEEAMESGKMQPLLDLELEYFYLKYQVDQALETKNKSLFMKVTEEYKDFLLLKEKVKIIFSG